MTADPDEGQESTPAEASTGSAGSTENAGSTESVTSAESTGDSHVSPATSSASTSASASASEDDEDLIAGRYRLISELGGGAMGVVWRARDEVLGRDVAVKQLRPDTGMSGAQVRQSHLRARREGRIAARLQHPNAVTIFDVAEHDGRPYLIMEYVPSSTLADILATGTVMTPEEVARIGAQLASALAAAHAVGIVHRDIKPGNVLMTSAGTVKLTDFGISRATGDATVTATGEILGTPAYTAPEVAQGHAVDSPADVFSLGATLYAAVEGTPPFGDDVNAMAVLLRVVRNEMRAPRRTGMLTDTILRMLSPEPAHRPTMRDVAAALASLGTALDPVAELRSSSTAREVTEALAFDARSISGMQPMPAPAPEPALEPTPTPDLAVRPRTEPAARPTPEATVRPVRPAPDPTVALGPEAMAAAQAEREPQPVAEPPAAKVRPQPEPTAAMPTASSTSELTNVGATTAMAAVADEAPLPGTTSSSSRTDSRRRLIFLGGGVGSIAVIAGIIVALSGGGGDNHPSTTPAAQSTTSRHSSSPQSAPTSTHAPSTPAASSAAAPPASTTQSTSASSASTTATSASSASSSPSGDIATQLSSTITSYYNLVPGNLDQAWNSLTTDYQQNKALGFANYQSFWKGMQRVTLSDVQAKAPDTVVATIDYYPKSGQATEERTSFTLVQDGGVWKIARSSVLSSRSI